LKKIVLVYSVFRTVKPFYIDCNPCLNERTWPEHCPLWKRSQPPRKTYGRHEC